MGAATTQTNVLGELESVRDLAILRDHVRSEQRVLAEAETPAEDLRNALQIMQPHAPLDFATIGSDDLRAVHRRVLSALAKLGPALVDSDDRDEIARLKRELDLHPNAFVLRVHRMEQRLYDVEHDIGILMADAGRTPITDGAQPIGTGGAR